MHANTALASDTLSCFVPTNSSECTENYIYFAMKSSSYNNGCVFNHTIYLPRGTLRYTRT